MSTSRPPVPAYGEPDASLANGEVGPAPDEAGRTSTDRRAAQTAARTQRAIRCAAGSGPWVIIEAGLVLVQLRALELLAWRRTIEFLSPDVPPTTLTTAEDLLRQLQAWGVSAQARALLHHTGLRPVVASISDDWGGGQPWQALARVHAECLRALVAEPRVLRRFAWPHAREVLRSVADHGGRVVVTAAWAWPKVGRLIASSCATEVEHAVVCGDDVGPRCDAEALLAAALELTLPDRCPVVVVTETLDQDGELHAMLTTPVRNARYRSSERPALSKTCRAECLAAELPSFLLRVLGDGS